MLDQGNTSAARALLAAACAKDPRDREIARLSTQIEIADQHWSRAIEILDEELARNPDDPAGYILRSHCHLAEGRIEQAVLDASQAVLIDPRNGRAQSMLGFSLARAGKMTDAAICLKEGIRSQPANFQSYLVLSEIEEKIGRSEIALRVLEEGMETVPGSIELRNAAALLAIRMNDFREAFDITERARKEGVVDATLFGLRGHALSHLGRREEAGYSYQEALKLGPDDPYVRHLVASFGALPGAGRASNEYIRVVFDGYAPRFDQHLIGLNYRVPGLIRSSVFRQFAARGRPLHLDSMLDLGCGTGLVGVVLSDLDISRAVGVDLSPKMLAEARSKEIYHELCLSEVGEFLEETREQFDLIVAGDVVCYFGDIQSLMRGVKNRLRSGGTVIFSVESHRETGSECGWQLGPAGRYTHSESYVRAIATENGLEIVESQEEMIRHEGGAPVWGFLLAMRHEGENEAA